MNNTESLNGRNLDSFNAVCEAILNTKGDIPSRLENELIGSYDGRASELIRFYARSETREAKNLFARWIGSFCKEKGLLALVDNLYAQQIGNGGIHAILKKHSLFADISLNAAECDTIISVMLDYLDTYLPEINSLDEENKFDVDLRNRTSAARILVVLNRFPNTLNKSKMMIWNKRDLIIKYVLADVEHEMYLPKTLDDYLSDRIG